MAIPVGAMLHSFSELIHPAYGHASQGGDWHRAFRRARWQDRECKAWCRFHNAGPQPPETLKTQSPDPAHFTYINVPASQENGPAGGPRQRLGHVFHEGGQEMETVCHGPLVWGLRSHLSSFRTTLVERYQDHFAVFHHCSHIRAYLSSPSALHSLPPTLLDPSQLKGLMAFWKNITGNQNLLLEKIHYTAAMLTISWIQSMCLTTVTQKQPLLWINSLPVLRYFPCQSRTEIPVNDEGGDAAADSVLPLCGERWTGFCRKHDSKNRPTV